MDVHFRAEITRGLRARGVDVRTAQDDGAHRLDDAALLDRAAALGRLIFSQEKTFSPRPPGDSGKAYRSRGWFTHINFASPWGIASRTWNS